MQQIKTTPHSENREMSVISLFCKDPEQASIDFQEYGMKDDYFFNPVRKDLFNLFLQHYEKYKTIDIAKMAEEREDELEKLGGASYLVNIYSYVTCYRADLVEIYIKELKELHQRREAIKKYSEAIDNLYNEDEEVTDVLTKTSSSIDSITEDLSNSGSSQYNMRQINELVLNKIERLHKGQEVGLPTGIGSIDRMTGGLQLGDLSIIGARPSVGKTALAMSFIDNISLKSNIPSMFFSSEMSAEAVGMRHHSSNSGVNLGLFNQQGASKEQLQSIRRSCIASQKAPIFIDDQFAITASEIRNKTRIAHRKYGIKAIFVDYIQRLKPESREESFNAKLRISNALKVLKNLARELNIHVCVLAQLNRDAEESNYDQLHSAMIADCGEVEQDADLIMLIGKNHEYEKEFRADQMRVREIKITKQRNGATGRIGGIIFKSECARFEEIPTERYEELNTFENQKTFSN